MSREACAHAVFIYFFYVTFSVKIVWLLVEIFAQTSLSKKKKGGVFISLLLEIHSKGLVGSRYHCI